MGIKQWCRVDRKFWPIKLVYGFLSFFLLKRPIQPQRARGNRRFEIRAGEDGDVGGHREMFAELMLDAGAERQRMQPHRGVRVAFVEKRVEEIAAEGEVHVLRTGVENKTSRPFVVADAIFVEQRRCDRKSFEVEKPIAGVHI